MAYIETPEIVVIGGGIGGAAFATVMARAGRSVLMLEITEQHRDVVRGEWMAPWGVMEAKRLDLYDTYRAHGAHHVTRHVGYDELMTPEQAEAFAIDLRTILPGIDGPMTIGHPRLCGILNDMAVAAGARFLRGVRKTHVTPGTPPTVTFEHSGVALELRPRLVIAADGRHGKTAQQVGIKMQADPVHHWFSGMLIENAHGWPEDRQSIGTVGGINYFVFPQGNGRARLYQGVSLEHKDRFMGDDAPQRFAEAFRMACVPQSDAIANGTPASHCFVYPNNDTWTNEPFAPGVIAIGDAAGHNDPIVGQGLSITHRDVRVVSDMLKATHDWSVANFQPYGEERRERMRRLRLAAHFSAVRDCEFGEMERARRGRLYGMMMVDPIVTGLVLSLFAGPENAPAEAFNEAAVDAILKAA
ncbi:MAG: FAD-dependent monooxygenase [Micropepsaceae bacterium]